MIQGRQSLRINRYNYAQAGAYFITICTFEKLELFGHITDGTMVINDLGQIVGEEWIKTPIIRPNILLDQFIVMPNHVHGIIIINHEIRRGVLQYAPTNKLCSPSQTIGAIIRGYKSATTKRINEHRQTPKRYVWQRNYFDHIIRNDRDLNNIQQYIVNNPAKWDNDEYNMKINT